MTGQANRKPASTRTGEEKCMRNSMKRSEMQRLIAIVCLAGSLLCLGGCKGRNEAACSPKDGGSSAGGPSEASAKVYGIER